LSELQDHDRRGAAMVTPLASHRYRSCMSPVCRRYHAFTAGSVEDELRVVSETAKLHVAARHGNDKSNTYIYRADATGDNARSRNRLAIAEPCYRNLTLTLRVPPSTICLLLRAAVSG
jgi:hypothetical protein